MDIQERQMTATPITCADIRQTMIEHEQFMDDLEEFLDNRADVDDGRPNEAMKLLVRLRQMYRGG